MNKKEQKQFVNELIENIRKDIIKIMDTKEIPENWDGIELRWYINDHYARAVLGNMGSKQRRKEYLNTVLVNNLD